MRGDPGLMVNALVNTQRVIGGNAVLTRMDLMPGQTGAGADPANLSSGALSVFLEATRRLKKTINRQTILACQVTGPMSLARKVAGAGMPEGSGGAGGALQAVLKIIKMIGEARPDLILIEEDDLCPEGDGGGEVSILDTVWNAIRYYDAEPLLVARNIGDMSLQILAENVSGIILLNNTGESDLEEIAFLHKSKGVSFGLPVPGEVFTGSYDQLDRFISDLDKYFGGKGVFACSAGEIPPGTSLECVRKVVDLLNKRR